MDGVLLLQRNLAALRILVSLLGAT